MKKDYRKLCRDHSDTFDEWFDKDQFDWEYSGYLAMYCHQHFDTWFDKNKFDWRDSDYLVIYCSKYFNIWYPCCPNKEKLNLTPVEIAQLRMASMI